MSPLIIFLNQDAKNVNDIIFGDNFSIIKPYEEYNIYNIFSGKEMLNWIIKTYSDINYAKKECKALKKACNIQGIPEILAVGFTKHISYIILSRMNGVDLYEYTEKNRKLDISEVQKIIKQLLQIVSSLHKLDIIHKDIKAENIIYDGKHVSLIDFEGKMTEDYLSPEYIQRSTCDKKYDVWCVGITCYFLLTGDCPFASRKEIIYKKINYSVTWPENLKKFLEGVLNKNYNFRLSAEEALQTSFMTT